MYYIYIYYIYYKLHYIIYICLETMNHVSSTASCFASWVKISFLIYTPAERFAENCPYGPYVLFLEVNKKWGGNDDFIICSLFFQCRTWSCE